MAKGVCRDCRRCTEAGIVSMIKWFPRGFKYWFGGGIFAPKCPICGHYMRYHERSKTGGFAD